MTWLFTVLALFLSLQGVEAAKAKTAAKPSIATSAIQARLDQLIAAAGENRTVGREGNARAYAWLVAEARKLKGWELEEFAFEPDVAFAVRAYREAFEPLASVNPKSAVYIRAKNIVERRVEFAESLRGKKLFNLILRKKGSVAASNKEPLVVTAGIDTLTGRHEPLEIFPDGPAPGADDNGAAVAALLEIARELAPLKPARTVELVFTNAEKAQYLGAHAYAEALLKKEQVARNVNLKMIGWNPTPKNRVNVYIRNEGQPGHERDMAIAVPLVRALTSAGTDAVVLRKNEDTGDQWAFWKSFHGAVMVSQDWEYGFNQAHFFSRTDRPDTLDWKYVTAITRGVAAAIPQLAR